MAALGVTYGILESGALGAPVAMSQVLDGTVSTYQDEIDAEAGIKAKVR